MTIPESDWKIFRELHAIALERFCEKVLDEVRTIASNNRKNFRERYLEVFTVIQRRDRELGLSFDDVRRSNALIQLCLIRKTGLLTKDEFLRFSPPTQEAIGGPPDF